MGWLRILLSRCAGFFRRRKLDDELDEELRVHIELAIEEDVRRGMSREDARTKTLREFGGVTQIKETYRVQRGLPFLETLAQDVRYALRQMRKAPGFAAVVILSLALGIGATTSMFSLIDAVLLHPVPYADWQRLTYPIMLNEDQPGSPERWFSVTWSQYQLLLKAQSIEDVLGVQYAISNVTGHDIPEDVTLTYFTENVGSFRCVPALLGRNLQPSDADAVNGQQAPVVLSYSFWVRHYNGDRDILGHVLELDHKPYLIVGVMPEDYGSGEPNLYVPMSLLPTRERDVTPIMKLKPGVSLAAADAEIGTLVHQFAKEDPQYFPRHFRIHLQHLTSIVMQNGGYALALLAAAVFMLLLIGCTNCSILLSARGMAREGEIAARAALGASRGRIVRQLLVEATVLAVAGSLAGVGLAYWMAKLIFGLFPDVFMHESVVRINLPVLAFSIVLAVTSGLLFGLLPSLRMSRPDIAQVMKAVGRKVAGHTGQARSLNTLIAAQIVLTTVLMGAAGAAIGGFLHMTKRNLGYDPAHVMNVPIPLHKNSYRTRDERAAYFETLRQKIVVIPGVTGAALSPNGTPPNSGDNLRFEILGKPFGQQQYLRVNFIDPEYFSILHIPLLAGRTWGASENTRGAAVAVINETLARRYFPDGNAIGQQIRTPTLTLHIGDPGQLAGVPDTGGWVQIIGVAGDVVNDGLDKPVLPAMYIPYPRFMWMRTSLLIRTQGPPLALLHSVQRAIQSVNPDQFEPTQRDVMDLNQWIDQQPEFKQQRLFSILFSLFSGLALALALVGLYSVVSYSVAQRTNEFGIRMALGAQRGHVLWIVIRSVGVTVLSGLGVGLVFYVALHKLLVHWMQNSYSNPLILVGAAMLFVICSAIACAVPALSAINIDPMQALRTE